VNFTVPKTTVQTLFRTSDDQIIDHRLKSRRDKLIMFIILVEVVHAYEL